MHALRVIFIMFKISLMFSFRLINANFQQVVSKYSKMNKNIYKILDYAKIYYIL